MPRRAASVRNDDGVAETLNLSQLIALPPLEQTLDLNGFKLRLRAIPAKQLDDLITKYPPEKDSDMPFNGDLRYELIALSVVNAELSIDDVKQLYDSWARPQITKLQSAAFDLNWTGTEAESLPLSETESEETAGTP
jgi:hypothetical protein